MIRTKSRLRSWPVFFSAASVVIGICGASAAPTKIVTGPDEGLGPTVNNYTSTGSSNGSFLAYSASFTGGVRVAMGDVRGTNDIITGAGPGSAPHVKVFTGPDRTEVYSFFAFQPSFNRGIYVAAGDIDGDGRADIIVGPGDAPGPKTRNPCATVVPPETLKVFSGTDGTTVLRGFYPFGPGYGGGIRVASGDVDNDGRADIIAATGPGGAQVNAYSGRNGDVLRSFIAYPGYTGGIYVACGDINGDGFDDIITGTGTGASHVKVFSGQNGSELQSFFAFPSSTGGVRVAGTDLNGNGRADIITATGPGDISRLKAVDGLTLASLVDLFPYGSSTAGVFPGAIPRFPAQSLNISTRTNVLNGDNALIGGFILTGTDSKFVIIRGIGPSSGVPGALADPTLELFSGNTSIATNNNWRDTQETIIQNTGIPPGNDLEAAIVRVMAPGSYTAVLRGNGDGTGVGLVEAYDLNSDNTNSQLANISTRGLVQTGNNVMIGGIILGGGTGANGVLVRAIGPSLGPFGIANPLPDPTLGLYDGQGMLIRFNDDWRQNQESEIQATGIPPTHNLESAVFEILPPGNYTAIVAGLNGATGVGLVEVYNLQ